MKPARPIAFWLVAAFVTLAAALMPSGARAHGSHAQAGMAYAAPVTVVALPLAAGPAVSISEKTALATRFVATAKVAAGHLACPGCAVCGHAPSSCCATGLAPSAVPALTPPPLAGRAAARDGPHLPGIVPEAQAEPPRSFA